MRSLSIAAGALLVLMTTSCGGGGGGYGPTGQDIDNSLKEMLQSVSGNWTGLGSAPNIITLEFKLTESNGMVSGTGTMKEENAAASVPITITGTFQRPVLTLAFSGMVYESRQVSGTMQGSYTTVGGIGAPLKMTATGYAKDVAVLWQEK